jgi:hypothetical protein
MLQSTTDRIRYPGMVKPNLALELSFDGGQLTSDGGLIIWTIAFIALGIYRFRQMDVIAASN